MLRIWTLQFVRKYTTASRTKHGLASRTFTSAHTEPGFTISKHAQNRRANRAAKDKELRQFQPPPPSTEASVISERKDAASLSAKVASSTDSCGADNPARERTGRDEKAGALNKIRKWSFDRPFRKYEVDTTRDTNHPGSPSKKRSVVSADVTDHRKGASSERYTYDERARGQDHSASLQQPQRARQDAHVAADNEQLSERRPPRDAGLTQQADLSPANTKQRGTNADGTEWVPRVKRRREVLHRLLKRRRKQLSKDSPLWFALAPASQPPKPKQTQLAEIAHRNEGRLQDWSTIKGGLARLSGTTISGVDQSKAISKSESSLDEADVQEAQLMDAIDDLTYAPPKESIVTRRVVGRRELHERMARLTQRQRKGISYLPPG